MVEADSHADDFARKEDLATPSLYSLPPEIIRILLDSTEVIERVRHDLAGEVLVTHMIEHKEEGKVIAVIPESRWEPIGERVMNDRGIRAVVKVLNTYINPESTLTQLSDDEIYKIIHELHKSLNALFYARGSEFEMNRNMKSIVINGIADICFFALKKSLNAKYIESFTKSWSVRELKGYPGEQKRGITDVILSPFRGKSDG